jgi:general secretion pathway protein G
MVTNVERSKQAGWTLIELLVVITIIGLLLGVAVPTFKNAQITAKEAVLKENLFLLRQTIDGYFADKGYYPVSLMTLKDDGYLRDLPVDPFTKKAEWDEIPADTEASVDPTQPPGIWDVKSLAEGQTRDGVPYSEL